MPRHTRRISNFLISGSVRPIRVWTVFLLGCLAHHNEQGMGQKSERDVPVPARPATDLILIQATFSLSGLKGLLDMPTLAGDPDQGIQ